MKILCIIVIICVWSNIGFAILDKDFTEIIAWMTVLYIYIVNFKDVLLESTKVIKK